MYRARYAAIGELAAAYQRLTAGEVTPAKRVAAVLAGATGFDHRLRKEAAMRLTRFTDYTLRTLAYLARSPGSLATINEIAGAYGISANHLMKVVQHLAAQGLIVTLRGKRGGLRLSRPADTIGLGEVVRAAEPDLEWLGCADPDAADGGDISVAIAPIVAKARDAFLAQLDRHTVVDLIARSSAVASTPEARCADPAPLVGQL